MERFWSIAAVLAISFTGIALADEAVSNAPPTASSELSIVRFHGEIACQGLDAAAWRPGELKLPLTVHERSGVARKGAVVSGGVPFPPGFLHDVSKLRVVDKDGRPVVCQAAVMTRWWKPAYDDSVQGALVSFQADVPAEGTATYFLTDDGQAAPPASPLKVARTDREITIDTGTARFAVPLAGEALLSKATAGGDDVLGEAGLRGTIVTGDWPDRGLQAGDRLVTSHEPSGVTVEESGPARVVVCIKGGYSPGDKEHQFYRFTARMTFAANDPAVRIVYSLENTKLDPTLYDSEKGKSRFAYVWPMQDVSLVADLAVGGKAAASTLGDGGLVSAEVTDQPLIVNQSKLDSFQVALGGRVQATGTEASGAFCVTGDGRGLAVARRYFHSEWPGVLAGSARELRVGLLPGESGEKFHFNVGQRKSWDVRLRFHGADSPDLNNLPAEHETLLLFRPEPAWMVRAAGITGSWSAGLHMGPAPTKVALRRTPNKLELPYPDRVNPKYPTSGWDCFGITRGWNAPGGHWNEESAFWKWVIHGDGDEFDSSEARTLWAADLCPVQFDRPDIGAFGSYIYYMRYGLSRLLVLTYPGYINRNTDYPDTGHMGMWMWHEYYLLTGDVRAREATCNLADYARAYLWRWTHDSRRDGIGGCKKMDPDTDPEFKLDRRYTGWPLYCLMQGYQFTGDPEMLAEGRIIARAFRNTARTSPIGQLVKDAASKTGTDAHDKQTKAGEFAQVIQAGNAGTVSQRRECHRSASLCSANLYPGIIVNGLREYYTYSRDVEALDTLVSQADHFAHHILIRNPQGKPAGWFHMFADYWGPYTWDDARNPDGTVACKFSSSVALVSDAVASIYHLTGRADVLELCRVIDAEIPRGRWPENLVNCLRMAVAHPKADQVPPAAIKDLAAVPLGGGKVKLTWTAPGGDGDEGRAAWYQAKWSPAPIVELTEGWPDRTEPLPATHEEWLARAKAFNARQRAFWAAFNLPGAPAPGDAGTKQGMTVENIPAGKAHFAIKTWDAASNASPLSNVVEVEVK